ncbi:MAG: HAD family hydrolase [Pseudomonadota bacterium]
MQGVTGVVFDKDGTLFDFEETWASWAKSFLLDLSGGDLKQAARLGDAILFDVRTCAFDSKSPVIASTPAEIAEHLLPLLPGATPKGLVTRMNAAAASAPQAETVPLIPFLSALRDQGLSLGLATNDAESAARAHLRNAGVLNYFDFIAGSDSGFGGKPQPGQLRAYIERTGQTPDRVVMVGDSTHDLMAARAAGCRAVAVLTGLATSEDLAPFADIVLDSIADLPNWLADEGLVHEAA